MITIKPENQPKIDAAIAAVEGHSTARTQSYYDAEAATKLAEKRLAALPKRLWVGVTVTYQPHTVPNAYGYRALTTQLTIKRTSTRWAFVEAERVVAPTARYGRRGAASDLRVTLPSSSATDLAEAFARTAHLEPSPWPSTDETPESAPSAAAA